MRLRRSQLEVYVGLDISPGRLKMVGLSAGPDGPVVAFASDEEIDQPAGRGSRFDPAAMGLAATEVLSRLGVRPRTVALALGPGEAVARRMTVVDQDPGQMLAAVSIQLGQALGADVAAPRVGFVSLPLASPSGRVSVFAAAARSEAVLAQQGAVAAAGWEQGPVTTTAVALVNAWRARRPSDASGRVVLLHVGESAAVWIVLEDGEPVAVDAPLVGVSSVRGRDWGSEPGSRPGDGPGPAALAEWAGRLRQEIARGLGPLQRAGGEKAEIWLSGRGSAVTGFKEALEAALSAPVRLYDPLSDLSWTSPAKCYGPALVPAFGAALQALSAGVGASGLLAIDLKASTPKRSGRVRRLAATELARTMAVDRGFQAVGAAAVVLWIASTFASGRLRERTAEVAAREARVVADSGVVATAMARTEELASRRSAMGTLAEAAARLDRGRVTAPRLLHSVSVAVPAAAWVSDVIADEASPGSEVLSFRIHGYAANAGVASAFARALTVDVGVDQAEVVRTETVKIGRSEAVRFEISGRSASAADPPRTAGGGA